MRASLLEPYGIDHIGEYLKASIYGGVYYPEFFPEKEISSLTYEAVLGEAGIRVMADVTAHDAKSPQKKRPTVSVMTGELPAIKVRRAMRTRDLYEFMALANLGGPSIQSALGLIYDDVDFTINGVQARLDYLAIQALSQTKLSLTATNNPSGITTVTDIDFGMPSANKTVGGLAAADRYWTTALYATATPITDLRYIRDTVAPACNTKVRYAVMNMSKWIAFSTATETKSFTTTYGLNGVSFTQPPTVQQVNLALRANDLPEIIVIDARVIAESEAGVQTTIDPWLDSSSADRYVTLLPDLRAGNMLYTMSVEEKFKPEQVRQFKRGNILVSKYSEVDPVTEYTKAEVAAFPTWNNIRSAISFDTGSHTTYGA